MHTQLSAHPKNGQATRTERLYFLDWLRVLAILIVFFVHCGKIFDYHTTVVVNTVRSPVLSALRDFCLLWVMPLFFVLSGAAIWLSPTSERFGKFIKSRFLRLLVPLVGVGTFIINPDGQIIWQHYSYKAGQEEEIKEVIERYLAGEEIAMGDDETEDGEEAGEAEEAEEEE